ncbi:MAG: hypothetical protein BWX52_01958 [Bacteroidetes bacterium ADurb.Bin013]|nr:MAG: hypothetical protein BWX52_01958 [Bacteroidetes bacterium ADurb.Bin013]
MSWKITSTTGFHNQTTTYLWFKNNGKLRRKQCHCVHEKISRSVAIGCIALVRCFMHTDQSNHSSA